jgi:ABC-2 type transport system permease protein
MAVAVDITSGADARRQPRVADFVRLKMRLLRNGLRGQVWRVVAFLVGLVFALWMAVLAALGLGSSALASRDVGFVVATFAGTAVVLGWTFFPLLFFGVDETLDPARFALLPVRPGVLAAGMLAAAFVGVPAAATLVGTSGLALAAGIRFGAVEAGVALAGVALGLVLGVVASRAVTSAFATLLRSRRMRDLAAVTIAVLASATGPLQWAIMAMLGQGSVGQALRVAEVLGWTPLGAPYVLPYDIAERRWAEAGARLALTVAVIALLLWWWSRTIESAMVGVSTGGRTKPVRGETVGAVESLVPPILRWVARPTAFWAIVASQSRFWWRDARRRASLVSILMASAVLPIALNIGGVAAGRGLGAAGLGFAMTMAGTMGGMLLGNQFGFDGSAYAAHLLAQVPGRDELRARAVAIGLVAVPVQVAVVVTTTLVVGTSQQLPTGLGLLAASFGSAVAAAAVLSVLAPYALPDNTNPFAINSGGGSAKGLLALVAMVATFAVTTPAFVAAFLLGSWSVGVWLVLPLGLAYGLGAAMVGTHVAGEVLERRGPEILVAVTPRR